MPEPHVAPRGPVLMCYRQDDGWDLAHQITDALRSVGVPVWLDQTDMRVGRFARTFRRAAEAGLSGTVFIATPNVTDSNFIQEDEAPVWDKLANDSDFILAVLNAGPPKADGTVDYEFPDRLLRLREQKLEHFKQYSVTNDDWLDDLARETAEERLWILRSDGPDDELRIEVSTRDEPTSTHSLWELRASIGPAAVLGPDEAQQVRRLTRELPRLASRLGRETVRLGGGIHLPVAAALGLSLPVTRPGRVIVVDHNGEEWGPSEDEDPIPLELDASSFDGDGTNGAAVLVDMVSSGNPDPIFRKLLAELGAPGRVIRARTQQQIPPSRGAATARHVAEAIRDYAGQYGTQHLHLCLRAPASLSLLVGRHLNTYRVSLYDYDRDAAGYVHFVDARAGGPDGNVILESP